MKRIVELERCTFFTMEDVEKPEPSQIWVKQYYDTSTNTCSCVNCGDFCKTMALESDTKVYVEHVALWMNRIFEHHEKARQLGINTRCGFAYLKNETDRAELREALSKKKGGELLHYLYMFFVEREVEKEGDKFDIQRFAATSS